MTAETPGRPRPFCTDKAAASAFDRWVGRLEAMGIELQEADNYVIGLLASREARLEGLVAELRRERDAGRRLKLIAAERLAAADMAKALDQAERVFGASVGEAVVEPRAAATGTDGNVIPFVSKVGLSPTAQRLVGALAKAGAPLTREALRRRVSGSQNAFLAALREAVAAGALVRSGSGRKGAPHVYSTRR